MSLRPPHLEVADFDRAATFLREADDVMLTSHVNSDGDGIGGCLALA
ncbi:MAG: hypothetical protein HOH74_12185, partial [Gemmatimonadetes bacterium]|nr:hypothetical protein [Gemmatimonadota bacterium]